jgi:hypothetical protein
MMTDHQERIDQVVAHTARAFAWRRKYHFLRYRDFARNEHRERRIQVAFSALMRRVTHDLRPQADTLWEVGILAAAWRRVVRQALQINAADPEFQRAKSLCR